MIHCYCCICRSTISVWIFFVPPYWKSRTIWQPEIAQIASMTIVKIQKIFIVKRSRFAAFSIILHVNRIKIWCAERINLSGFRIFRNHTLIIYCKDWSLSAWQCNMFKEIPIIWGRGFEKLHVRPCFISVPREINLKVFFSCCRCLCKIDLIYFWCTFDLHRCEREISFNRKFCSPADTVFLPSHINIRLILTTGNCSAWQGNFIKLGML